MNPGLNLERNTRFGPATFSSGKARVVESHF